MEESTMQKSAVEQAGEDLFNFAVDREDVKTLLAALPDESDLERVRLIRARDTENYQCRLEHILLS